MSGVAFDPIDQPCPYCGMTSQVEHSRKRPGRLMCLGCAQYFFPKDSGGDPDEVRPPDSLAESQTELNGPSGSPTSPPGRVRGPHVAPDPLDRIGAALDEAERLGRRQSAKLLKLIREARIEHSALVEIARAARAFHDKAWKPGNTSIEAYNLRVALARLDKGAA